MKLIDYIQAGLAAVIAMLGGVQVLAPFLGTQTMGIVTAATAIVLVGLHVFQSQLPGGKPAAPPAP